MAESEKSNYYKTYQNRSMFYTDLMWKNFLAYGALLAGLVNVNSSRGCVLLGGCLLLLFLGWFQVINVFLVRKTTKNSIEINDMDRQLCWVIDRYVWSAIFMLITPVALWAKIKNPDIMQATLSSNISGWIVIIASLLLIVLLTCFSYYEIFIFNSRRSKELTG